MNVLPDNNPSLTSLRADIDDVDSQLLRLLARRARLVKQIGLLKAGVSDVPAYDRLLPMLKARGEQAKALGLDADFTVRLFQQIAHQAMALQRQPMAPSEAPLPLVYSCSGCSSSAQLANDLALALDREQQAEMSCIAGVGGDVAALLKPAQSGRPILVIDGCARACAYQCLQRHGINPNQHVVLSKLGVQKRQHQHYRAEEFLQMKPILIELLASVRANAMPASTPHSRMAVSEQSP